MMRGLKAQQIWSLTRSVVFVVLLSMGSVGLAQTVVPNDDPALQIREYDVIELLNGRKLEGTILEDRIDAIVFREKSGIQSRFARSEIRGEPLRKNPPADVYALRRKSYFDRDSIEDQKSLAQWCLDVGLTPEGILHLEESTRLNPNFGETYDLLLDLYRSRSEAERSITQLDRELAASLRAVEALGRPEWRIHAANLLVSLGDKTGEYAGLLLLEPLGSLGPGDPYVETGQDLYVSLLAEVGREEEARRLVDRWLEARGGTNSLVLWRLRARWLLEDVAAGIDEAGELLDEVLSQILAADPESGKAYLYRGSLDMLRGDPVGARADFQRAFELGEVGAEAAVTYALNFAREGNASLALELIGNARSASSVEDLVKVVEAYVMENTGESEVAALLLEEGVNLPNSTWQSWVVSLQGRSRFSEDFPLDREIERALERFSNNPAAFAELSLLRGDRALATGAVAEARRWLGYAVAAGRDLPEVLLRLGLSHLEEGGDLRTARACLEAAALEGLENVDLNNALGCLEYREGNLTAARRHFSATLRLTPAEAEGEPIPARQYATAALEQIDRAEGEEVWTDSFDRPDGPQILNKWEKSETFGIRLGIRDGAVQFNGTQKFQSEGLTRLTRTVDGSTLARVRAQLKISPGTRARIGLRLSRRVGSGEEEGIVVFRDLDGMLCAAINNSEDPIVIRSDTGSEGVSGLTLNPTRWPEDGEPHWLEIRMPRPEDPDPSISVYLDGKLVMRGIEAPQVRRRGEITVGVSGQAVLDQSYRFDVLEFEIFRTRPKTERGPERR